MYIKEEIQELYDNLEIEVEKYLENFDRKNLKKAFYFAYKNFSHKKTKYWQEKIVHLLNTAHKLASLQAWIPSVIAGLLHSYKIERSNKKEFGNKFWQEITKLIIWVNNISNIVYSEWMTTKDIDFLKKIFKIWWKDLRVLFIKICEKIDWIENIINVEKELRRQTAIEVTEIYSPMIKILWIWKFFWNIDDICYKYIHPKEFENISNIINKDKENLENRIIFLENQIKKDLEESNIVAKIESRIKSISSIAKKIKNKGISIPWIYDIIALRIITENKNDAYVALWIIHSHFKVRWKRIKDYISAPKGNWYQSLHTTLSDNEGRFFEVQIQTKEMYKLNTFWLASHSWYKGISSSNNSLPEWMQDLLKNQKQQISWKDFIDSLNINNLKDTISCETPSWEIIELPKGSTILDFAFKIHTEIWKQILWAWINNIYSENLMQYIKEWDLIKLDIWKEECDYPVKYVSFVKTSLAKKHIKKLLKNKSKDKRILLWEHLLNNKMRGLWYKSFSKMPETIKIDVFKKIWLEDSEELFLEIWWWNIDINKIIDLIYNLWDEKNKYTSTVLIKITLKKKDHNNLYLISNVFHNLDINVKNIEYKWLIISAEVNVKNFLNLQELLAEISRVPNVISTKRQLTNRNIWFISIIIITGFFILASPFILFFIENFLNLSNIIYEILFYINVFFFIWMLYFFKSMAKNTLRWIINKNIFWIAMWILNTITLITVIIESIYIFNNDNSIFFFSLILILYGLTLFEYIDNKIPDDEEK